MRGGRGGGASARRNRGERAVGGDGDTAVAADGVGTGYAAVTAGAQPLAEAADGPGSC